MKKLTALVLALCMALGLVACGGSKDTGSAAGSTAAASGDTVKIGVYEPQSGDNGAGGKQEILGVQYANSIAPTVEIGGKTYNVKLEIVDNESSNDKAVSAASQLVSQGVSVVLGSYGSGVSIAASDTFKNAGVPAIGITCTNPAVTAGNTHYFRACFIDSFQGPVLANYAYDNLKVKKAYCLSKLGDDYSGGLVSYFTKQFEKKGGQVVKATATSPPTLLTQRRKAAAYSMLPSPLKQHSWSSTRQQARTWVCPSWQATLGTPT